MNHKLTEKIIPLTSPYTNNNNNKKNISRHNYKTQNDHKFNKVEINTQFRQLHSIASIKIQSPDLYE